MNILKKARIATGLTQEHAAKLIGVSKRTLIRWEQKENLPELTHVPRISRIYSLSIEEICIGLVDN